MLHIPLSKPYFDEQDAQAVANVVRSGWILQGPQVEKFESLLADYIGVPYAIACSSCTTALQMSLQILGIATPEDEVIVPSFSYIATANSVVHAHGTPVFADIDPKTYNIDPMDIERKITKHTKAIIAVHQFGLPADMPRIIDLVKKHNLALIEDAACGLGSSINGQQVGTFGDLACFSFHPRKAITTAEGGLITTKNKEWAHTASMLRAHGSDMSVAKRHASTKVLAESFPLIGYNFRMSDIHAALGISQMNKFATILKKRQHIAKIYTTAFQNHPVIIPPFVPEGHHHTYQTYIIRLKGLAAKRNEIMQKLLDQGISTRAGIPSAHLEKAYSTFLKHTPSLPVTELASRETLCLPVFTEMTDEMIQTVIHSLTTIINTLS